MEHLIGETLTDEFGNAIGTVTDVFYADRTLEPEMVTVRTRRLFSRDHVVPIVGAEHEGDCLLVHFSRHQVLSAPVCRAHTLPVADRRAVYEHYHLAEPRAA
jgi:hypothetical protein